ncbi:hypothetical protein N0V85_007436, partial [Neurospora sp. IMI 360204]
MADPDQGAPLGRPLVSDNNQQHNPEHPHTADHDDNDHNNTDTSFEQQDDVEGDPNWEDEDDDASFRTGADDES